MIFTWWARNASLRVNDLRYQYTVYNRNKAYMIARSRKINEKKTPTTTTISFYSFLLPDNKNKHFFFLNVRLGEMERKTKHQKYQ